MISSFYLVLYLSILHIIHALDVPSPAPSLYAQSNQLNGHQEEFYNYDLKGNNNNDIFYCKMYLSFINSTSTSTGSPTVYNGHGLRVLQSRGNSCQAVSSHMVSVVDDVEKLVDQCAFQCINHNRHQGDDEHSSNDNTGNSNIYDQCRSWTLSEDSSDKDTMICKLYSCQVNNITIPDSIKGSLSNECLAYMSNATLVSDTHVSIIALYDPPLDVSDNGGNGSYNDDGTGNEDEYEYAPFDNNTNVQEQTNAPTLPSVKPNILIVMADDLNPQFGPYIDSTHPMYGKTPNFDEFARSATVFNNAYTQFASCGPSRQSFMSGRRPDTLKLYNFEKWLPEVSPLLYTMPKYFKEKLGYYAAAYGKVFHENRNQIFANLYYTLGHFSQPIESNDILGNEECADNRWYCAWKEKADLTDTRVAGGAIRFIQSARIKKQLPFFLVVGFRRPHIANSVPKGFPMLIDIDKMDFPTVHEPQIEGVTFRKSLSRFECTDEIKNNLLEFEVQGKATTYKEWQTVIALDKGRKRIADLTDYPEKYKNVVIGIRRAYLSGIIWVDDRFGQIMKTLRDNGYDDNTIIIVTGDHGFSNGDKGVWCKNSVYETPNRVPLMIKLPSAYLSKQQRDEGNITSSSFKMGEKRGYMEKNEGKSNNIKEHHKRHHDHTNNEHKKKLKHQSNKNKGLQHESSMKQKISRKLYQHLPKLVNHLHPKAKRLGLQSARGSIRYSKSVVQLLDVFPTLIDLVERRSDVDYSEGSLNRVVSGLKVDDSNITLDGTSFARSIVDPHIISSSVAYSQFPRCEGRFQTQTESCAGSPPRTDCLRPPIQYMGYSIRTPTHRYIEWRKFIEVVSACRIPYWVGQPKVLVVSERFQRMDPTLTRTVWEEPPVEIELYTDYPSLESRAYGDWEKKNLAFNADESTKKLLRELSLMIQYRHDPMSKYNKGGVKPICSNHGVIELVNDGIKEIETCKCYGTWKGADCSIM